MTGLLLLLLIGCAILILGLFVLFLRMPAKESGTLQVVQVELGELVELRALRFKNFSRLFSDSDYRALRTEPRLFRSAETLRQDRRRLALRWLAALRSDVLSLWRLRRLLTAYGISQGVGAELVMTMRALALLAAIAILRMGVFVFGPFALSGSAQRVRRYIETYTRSCRAALARLPRNKFADFSAEWRTRQALAA
jgi:hypothetical protein